MFLKVPTGHSCGANLPNSKQINMQNRRNNGEQIYILYISDLFTLSKTAAGIPEYYFAKSKEIHEQNNSKQN